MAFIFRDALSPAVAAQMYSVGVYHKFDAAWPRDFDPKAYYPKLYFYISKQWVTDKALIRFLKAIGISYDEFIEQPVDDEIEDMWFYLRPEYQWDGSTIGLTIKETEPDPIEPQVVSKTYDPVPALIPPTTTEIAEKINDTFSTGDMVDITIEYGGVFKRYITEHINEWLINEAGTISNTGLNTTTIENIILADPWYFLANSRHLDYTKNSNPFQLYGGDIPDFIMPKQDSINTTPRTGPLCEVSIKSVNDTVITSDIQLGLFALMSVGVEWEIVPVATETIFDRITSTTPATLYAGEVQKYAFSIRLKFNGTTTKDSKTVVEIDQWYDTMYQTISDIPITLNPVDQYKETQATSTIDTKYKDVMINMMENPSKAEDGTVTNSLYINSKLSVEAAKVMKKKDFIEMLANTIDTDYKVEKASWWETALAVVIVIVAIVVAVLLAIPTGGASMGTVAAGLSAASAILGAGMMLLSAFGGLSAQGLVKIIGAFAQIVGIAAMVVGVVAAVNNAIQNVARKALLEQGITNATATQISTQLGTMTFSEIALSVAQEAVTSALGSVTEVFTALTDKGVQLTVSTVINALESTLSLAQKGMEFYADQENEKLISETKSLQAEYDELTADTDNVRTIADPLYVLLDANERLATYDALSYMEMDWKIRQSPQGFFDKFEAERSIK